MAIEVRCDRCQHTFQAKEEYAGRRVACPTCGNELTIPGDPHVAASVGPDWGKYPTGEVATSGKAVASMVLGLFSFVLSCLTGIPAIILGVMSLNEIKASQGRVKGQGMALTGIITGGMTTLFLPIIGILIALLLPAVQAAREAARRAQCTNNLKQIGLALHNYHSDYGSFPPAFTTDENGQPLLSWRVLILPYMEASSLYDQFHLDEPWDSPHNGALMSQMPTAYACPSYPPTPGQTTYQAIVGPGAFWEGDGESVALREIIDGASNTLAVAESSVPVPWTSPQDLAYQPGVPPQNLGSMHPGGRNVLFGDGSVRFIRDSIDPMTLQALTTRAGGEVVGPDAY